MSCSCDIYIVPTRGLSEMRKGTVMFAFLLNQQNRDFGLGLSLADFLHKHTKTDIHCPEVYAKFVSVSIGLGKNFNKLL